jgi:exodeoxyribonuclease V alpha subunit
MFLQKTCHFKQSEELKFAAPFKMAERRLKIIMRSLLEQACERGKIRPVDLHLGLFLEQQAMLNGKRNRRKNADLLLAATLASAAAGCGHVCLPLEQSEALILESDLLPHPARWRRSLLATKAVGEPGETAPLILDKQNRLYLYRFHCCEELIASSLRERAATLSQVEHQTARPLLKRLFPGSGPDLQQTAAALALLKPFVIISGGPGTGKTYTVARILALLQNLHDGGRPLRIALAAPTGKAAARLEESIRAAKQALPDDLASRVPEQAQTLHRLLGARPGAEEFRHNRDNPLPLDLLVVDEASMIDLLLMAALLQALLPHTRLILLGDRSQLASVEAGSLFADLCGSGEPAWSPKLCEELRQLTGTEHVPTGNQGGPLADSCILLRQGYRFQGGSGIGSLAAAVNRGAAEEVEEVLRGGFADLHVACCTGREREAWLRERILDGFAGMVGAASLEEAFAAMEQFRFLCAVLKGPNGTEGINSLAAAVLAKVGLTAPNTDWHRGKPLIILRNQYDLQLFNGDTGLLWPDGRGRLRAWFRQPDGGLRPISPTLLPEHEAAFAVTVHKAQGSEFDQALLLLPEEDSRVLSRELLYTGITRARTRLVLCAGREILAAAVRQRTRRYSGLAEKLHSTEACSQIASAVPFASRNVPRFARNDNMTTNDSSAI